VKAVTMWPQIEKLGCCAAGHVTQPARAHGRYRCIRNHGLPCRQPVVMLRDHPAVEAAMLLGIRISGGWQDVDVFQMLVDLRAWGPLPDDDLEPVPPG
jgi:hypothetical protein